MLAAAVVKVVVQVPDAVTRGIVDNERAVVSNGNKIVVAWVVDVAEVAAASTKTGFRIVAVDVAHRVIVGDNATVGDGRFHRGFEVAIVGLEGRHRGFEAVTVAAGVWGRHKCFEVAVVLLPCLSPT